jgi:hypothetical protein
MIIKETAKKIYPGCYLYKGFYISAYEGTQQRIWNIYNDEACTDEFAIGFYTLAEAKEYLN